MVSSAADASGTTVTVGTDAPDERNATVRLEPVGDGTIALHVEAGVDVTGIALDFTARPDERYFGLGERADAVDHRGRVVENRVLDGLGCE